MRTITSSGTNPKHQTMVKSETLKRYAQLIKAKQQAHTKPSAEQDDEGEQPKVTDVQLAASSDDDDDDDQLQQGKFSLADEGEDFGDDDEEETRFEKESRELEESRAREALDAEAELKLNIADREEVDVDMPLMKGSTDLKVIHERMQNVLFVLSNFSEHRKEGKSRADYIEMLAQDISTYFGYSFELAEKFLQLFPPAEAMQFIEANETARPVTLRVNTLKCRRKDLTQALVNRGVNLDPIGDWTNVGLKVYQSQVPLGATPEYLAGHYILQSASSFLPVMALNPQENERILDMSCAPGGKASYISACMKNTGVLVANDLSKDRQKATIANLHRLGVRNAIVTAIDGRTLKKHYDSFDRVLLDAPCTGLGIISRDPSVKINRKVEDIPVSAKLQKELILAAIDMLKVSTSPDDASDGGVLVYSTCSVTVEENEDVVAYALRKRFVRLEAIDESVPFGVEGFCKWRDRRFHESMKLTKRFYPHVHNMDGFFVARLRKLAHGPRSKQHDEEDLAEGEEEQEQQAEDSKKSNNRKRKEASKGEGQADRKNNKKSRK
eukprot:TRINITY_DN2376_c0_g1_i1.p1 TRINITY_DN2376_c0_g1~~TRINITY_DN2376_c0_g1_i1.p1  ORF type:complete len:554 (+),score=168.00 TRINITY_DN2376_c0_g1_i1:1-1662(+)